MPLRFSIIIANYNYEHFVARAIDSALGQDWGDIEVIVVDDGSRDGSRSVIEGYGARINAIFQANAGQRVANNTGFAACTGDVVVFLDADDVLEPDFAREVAAVWREGLSKVQVLMRLVDAQERPLGPLIPRISHRPSAAQMQRWARNGIHVPMPPGSGNAYARGFLAKFFPLGPEHDSFTDSTTLIMAPLLGEIETVMRPLVLYRQHGDNDSNLANSETLFSREILRHLQRQESARILSERLGLPVLPNLRRRGFHLLQLRVASMRLRPADHPLAEDGVLILLYDCALHLVLPCGHGLAKRLSLVGWTVATLLAPRRLARWLIARRFYR